MACSSIQTGRTACCRCELHCMIHGSIAAYVLLVVCKYLCSDSRILSTHWDSGSKQGKMNYGMFLHSDRQDYRLQM